MQIFGREASAYAINLAFDGFGIILSLIPIIGMISKWNENKTKYAFVRVACASALFLLGDGLERMARSQGGVLRGLSRFGLYITGFLLLAAFALYVLPRLEGRLARLCASGRRVWVWVGAAILSAAVSAWGGAAWLPAALAGGTLLALTGTVLWHMRSLGRREAVPLLLCAVLPVVALALQPSVQSIGIVTVAVVLALLVLYVSVQGEQIRSLGEREVALSKSSMELMLSQIQPHFLYNSLVAISQLCEISPAEASEMVGKFSQYLKVNVDSLQQREPIPFADELDHVKIYLFIEQTRFEEKLNIEMDIRTVDFRVPVLSLQPIVENAVRHGVTKREEGGTVRITTEAVAAGFRITVQDDGVGFAKGAPQEDGRSHLGIENVRQRLASVCAGALQIDSTPGQGTTATIIIPREA